VLKPTHFVWRGLFHLVSIFIIILYAICFIFHIQSLHEYTASSFLSMWLTILGILSAYLGITWLTIIVHELGHTLAAWLVGFRIDLIVIGPLKLIRVDDRLRWRVNTHSFAPGFVIATPQDSHRLISKYVLFILAGPAFSLLLAIASLLLCLSLLDKIDVLNFTYGLRNKSGVYLQLFFVGGFCFLMNFGSLLLSIIPMLVRGKFLNDGAILLRVLQQSEQITLRDQQISTLGYMMATEGIRPNQWNRDELLQCLGAKSLGTVSDVHAYLMGYYYFLDSNEIQAAEALLEKALESFQTHRSEARLSVLLESVYFKAFYHNDVTQAAEYLKLCEGTTEVEQPTRLRAEAAVHLVEKQYKQCLHKAELALKELQNSKDRGGALAEADWINAIITRCEKAIAPTSPPAVVNSGIRSSLVSR